MRSSWNCTNNFSIMKNGSNRNLQSMGIYIQYFVLTRKSLKFCDKWILKWLGLSLPWALTKTRPWTLLLLQKYISSHMYWEDSPCFPHVLSNLSLLICQLLFDLLCCLIHDDPSEWSKAWTWFDVIDLSEQTGIVVLSTVVPTSFMGVDSFYKMRYSLLLVILQYCCGKHYQRGEVTSCHLIGSSPMFHVVYDFFVGKIGESLWR